jgi:hypothetical protein
MSTSPEVLPSLASQVAASALGSEELPGGAAHIAARVLRPDFTRWQAHAARANGCTRPVRLRGQSVTVNARTGEVVETFDTEHLPDKTLYKRCGTRRESVCPACADKGMQVDDAASLELGDLRVAKPSRSAAVFAGSSPRADPAETGRPACIVGRCPAGWCTATATRAPEHPCASTATTTSRRSRGMRTSRSCGPGPSMPSSVSSPGSPATLWASRWSLTHLAWTVSRSGP